MTEHKVKFRFDLDASVWIAEEWRRDKYVPARRLELPESASLDEVEAAYRQLRKGRSRAESRAAGLVELTAQIRADLVAAVDAEAERLGITRSELVAGWAKRLAKRGKSDNRQSPSK